MAGMTPGVVIFTRNRLASVLPFLMTAHHALLRPGAAYAFDYDTQQYGA